MSEDLLFQDEIREVVRSVYGRLPHGAGHQVAARLYPPDALARVPPGAVDWALGVGDPVGVAGLGGGETVLDVGCGGGIDTVLAAREVGPTGRVIGVDTLPEMCERARSAVAEAGVADRCEILEGEMEALPLPDASADAVISNGVPNLSPRKARAFAEMARVLRPGGRLCIADLTVDDALPDEVATSGALWAGCIAGALSADGLARRLERAGLTGVRVEPRLAFSVDDVAGYPLFTDDAIAMMRATIPAAQQGRVATSVIARGRRPPA